MTREALSCWELKCSKLDDSQNLWPIVYVNNPCTTPETQDPWVSSFQIIIHLQLSMPRFMQAPSLLFGQKLFSLFLVLNFRTISVGGSLFLFDRKILRYFRKDGHNWRKKKDGKTIKEAHEKLKVSEC